jgi:hypothetical protein
MTLSPDWLQQEIQHRTAKLNREKSKKHLL